MSPVVSHVNGRPPCRMVGRLTPRPITSASSHFALLLACESDWERPRKAEDISHRISQPASADSLSTHPVNSVHPTPPMSPRPSLTMLMHSFCCNSITRRRSPSHVGPHRHSHRDLASLTSSNHQGHPSPSPGGGGCPACKHEAPSSATNGPMPRSYIRLLVVGWLHESCSSSTSLSTCIMYISSFCTQHA